MTDQPVRPSERNPYAHNPYDARCNRRCAGEPTSAEAVCRRCSPADQSETITVSVEVLRRLHNAAARDAYQDGLGRRAPGGGMSDWPTFLARLREQATTGRCEHTFSHATPGRVSLRCSLNAGHDGQHS